MLLVKNPPFPLKGNFHGQGFGFKQKCFSDVFLFSLFVIRVTQTKQNKEKVADYLHEVDKPLARYRDDKDLEMMLKEKEREDDPMLAYMRQKKKKQDIKAGKKGEIGATLEGHYFFLLLFNPLSPNILLTVPRAFFIMVLLERICSKITTFHLW